MKRVHRIPMFRRMWAANISQEVSRQVGAVALSVTAVVFLDASPTIVGIIAALANGAYLVLGLPAGAMADRFDCRLLLVCSDVVRALALASIPIAYLAGCLSTGQVLAVAALVSAASVVADTAQTALLPAVVGRSNVGEATARIQMTDSTVQIAGPGGAGLLLARMAAPLVFGFSAIASAVAAVIMMSSRFGFADPGHGSREGKRTSVLAGLKHCWSQPLLRMLILCGAAANFAGGMLTPLVQLYALRDLGMRPSLFGVSGGIGAAGGVVGSVLVIRMANRLGDLRTFRWVQIALPVVVVLFPVLALSGLTPFVCLSLSLALLSMVLVVGAVPAASMRALVTPSSLMGRVASAMRIFSVGTLPLGSLLGGGLASMGSARLGIWIAGLVALLGLLPILPSSVRHPASVPTQWHAVESAGPDT